MGSLRYVFIEITFGQSARAAQQRNDCVDSFLNRPLTRSAVTITLRFFYAPIVAIRTVHRRLSLWIVTPTSRSSSRPSTKKNSSPPHSHRSTPPPAPRSMHPGSGGSSWFATTTPPTAPPSSRAPRAHKYSSSRSTKSAARETPAQSPPQDNGCSSSTRIPALVAIC